MLKADFRSLLDGYIKKDPRLAVRTDDNTLTPTQEAVQGLSEGIQDMGRPAHSLDAPSLTQTEPNSTIPTPEQEGYQDISLTAEPLLPV